MADDAAQNYIPPTPAHPTTRSTSSTPEKRSCAGHDRRHQRRRYGRGRAWSAGPWMSPVSERVSSLDASFGELSLSPLATQPKEQTLSRLSSLPTGTPASTEQHGASSFASVSSLAWLAPSSPARFMPPSRMAAPPASPSSPMDFLSRFTLRHKWPRAPPPTPTCRNCLRNKISRSSRGDDRSARRRRLPRRPLSAKSCNRRTRTSRSGPRSRPPRLCRYLHLPGPLLLLNHPAHPPVPRTRTQWASRPPSTPSPRR